MSNSGSVDKRLSPDISAKLLVSNAVLNITRKRITAKTNALAGNVSGKVLGTITAPARQVDKPQLVKLDPMTKRIAALFGNTAEEASNMLR
ncbi:MAG TPA: hypothetical protein ACFYD4_13595 [Candidatus Wunengus sp. YC61]|uniref:hypothetical protein n=1 Tax=Candidatus Wunengus sp. YC61 TaxID=3367698 RepID=UPI0040277D25